MKKLISTILVVALVLGMSAFGLASGAETKALVVYFSQTGNTEAVAKWVAGAAGADIVKLELADPYPDDMEALSARAEQEHNDNTLPELTTVIENMDQYDTVYLGYPIWQGDFPQAIASFLAAYDLAGKTVAPFCTCGSSGLGETPARIKTLQPDAAMVDGLAVMAADVPNAEAAVTDWVNGLAK